MINQIKNLKNHWLYAGQQLIARVKELSGCFDFIFPNIRPNRVKVF